MKLSWSVGAQLILQLLFGPLPGWQPGLGQARLREPPYSYFLFPRSLPAYLLSAHSQALLPWPDGAPVSLRFLAGSADFGPLVQSLSLSFQPLQAGLLQPEPPLSETGWGQPAPF